MTTLAILIFVPLLIGYRGGRIVANIKYNKRHAKVWVNKLEAEPNGDVSRLLPEMLRVVAFQTIGQMGETEVGANPMEVMLLAKALQHMSAAGKDHMAMELKMRDERKKLLAEQSAKLDAMGNKGGVTEETKRAIREALGIV